MSAEVTIAANLLFPAEGVPIRDIKFFDMARRGITAIELAELVIRGETAIQSGRSQPVDNLENYLTV
jgi:hypothetical protein